MKNFADQLNKPAKYNTLIGDGSPQTDERISKFFIKALLVWNQEENIRQMPWKGETDPYKIWISEIILQQTRVQQGLNYYNDFISAFPTIESLANANEEAVFKKWEGLGYYSRCRNLIKAARIIYETKSEFPKGYEGILALPGIGPYTAAAIASFAFNLHYAVLDGNVSRVLSRIFKIETPIDTTEGKKLFTRLAQAMLPIKESAPYNQAIMDFGATICSPKPLCAICFMKLYCASYKAGVQHLLPIKAKKVMIRKRQITYYIIRNEESILIRQRKSQDIWNQLYEFIGKEDSPSIQVPQQTTHLLASLGLSQTNKSLFYTEKKQKLTHQEIDFTFIIAEVKDKLPVIGCQWITLDEVIHYPFPKTLANVLKLVSSNSYSFSWQKI